eukprot:NODE_259_length_11524_cov_0.251028.p6 type:complete len:139 gc:universal NODE_259_length_11524_cov_0.251028:5623-6039(+)
MLKIKLIRYKMHQTLTASSNKYIYYLFVDEFETLIDSGVYWYMWTVESVLKMIYINDANPVGNPIDGNVPVKPIFVKFIERSAVPALVHVIPAKEQQLEPEYPNDPKLVAIVPTALHSDIKVPKIKFKSSIAFYKVAF